MRSQASQTLGSALVRSRRSSFVKQYLYVLWPSSEGILLELARRLGDEVALPGEKLSLLADCLAQGAKDFYRLKGDYKSSSWDQEVFLHFFQGVFTRGAAVFGCRVQAQNDTAWDPEQMPYLDWRKKNPGKIEISWLPEASNKDQAGKLIHLVLSGCQYPQTFTIKHLLNLLGGNGTHVR